ncbi:MAG: DNA methyltransferase [Pyrinomonadaceae bacterium]
MPDLNFDGYNTLYATHGLHAYAAKCPPQLVRYALRYYSKPGETVLDPMVGSGTALVEARLMGRHACGYDIDPLARLIAQVKSRKVSDSRIELAYEVIVKRSARDLVALQSPQATTAVRRRATPPNFPNQDYWFDSDVSAALAILSYHIGTTPMSGGVRDFFWVAFSSLILARTSVANARDIIHSRHHHWLHTQKPNVLARFAARVGRMQLRTPQDR